MDKYEYKIRAEEIKTLIAKKKFTEAAKVADTIDWTRVKSVAMLCTVSDLYKVNRRFEEAKALLEMANERHPAGRMIIYSLCDITIKMGDILQAIEYYKDFVQIAPTDSGRYVLQYKIYEAQDVGLEERIAVLEELKKRDYREKWAYELAYLYHRIGLASKCVEECDELILWFGEGKYVIKALELKMLHQPLSPAQQQKYDTYLMVKQGKAVPQELGEDEAPKRPAASKRKDTHGRRDESLDGDMSREREPSQGRETAKGREASQRRGIPQTGDPSDRQRRPAAGEAAEETAEGSPSESEASDDGEMDIHVKPVDVGKYNTMNLQKELAKSMEELMQSGQSAQAAAAYQILQQDPAQAIEPAGDRSEPVFGSPQPFEQSGERDGEEIREIYVNRPADSEADIDKQITGQMNIQDIMSEWEMTKRQNEEKRRQEVEQRVLQETGPLFKEFDEVSRKGILEQMQREERLPVERRDRGDEAVYPAPSQDGRTPEAQTPPAAQSQDAVQTQGTVQAPLAEQAPAGVQTQEDVQTPVTVQTQGTAQTPYAEQPPAAVQTQGTVQTPYAEQPPAAVQTQGTVQTPYAEQSPAAVQTQGTAQTPYAEQPPAAVQTQGTVQTPYAEQPPAAVQTQGTVQTPYAEQSPAAVQTQGTAQTPYAVQPPAAVQTQGTVQTPYAEQTPVAVQTQGTEQTPYAGQPPAAVQTQGTEQTPYAVQPPAAVQTQGTAQTPYAEQSPAAVQTRGAVQPPYVEQVPATVQTPSQTPVAYQPTALDAVLAKEPTKIWDAAEVEQAVKRSMNRIPVTENAVDKTSVQTEAEYNRRAEEASEASFEGAGRGEAPAGEVPGVKNRPAEDRVMVPQERQPEKEGPTEPENMVPVTAAEENGEMPDEPEELRQRSVKETSRRKEERAPRPEASADEPEAHISAKQRPASAARKAVPNAASAAKTSGRTAGEEKSQSETRSMSKSEKKLFAAFVPTKGAMRQLIKALDMMTLEAGSGNLIISAEEGCDTDTLAKNVVKDFKSKQQNFSGKLAKINGGALNEKDPGVLFGKLADGALIIESAGQLSRPGAVKLMQALGQMESGLLVIMIDSRRMIRKLINANPELPAFFNASFDLVALDNATLVMYGCQYAKNLEYSIDELGKLALHTRIEDMQTIDHVVTVSDVRDIVDEAIAHANRKTPKHFMDVLLAKRYDDDDMIILREKDFV